MPDVSPTQVNPQDEITAASVNTPVNQLAAAINDLDNDNFATNAGISGTKLADSTIDLSLKAIAGSPVQVVSTNFPTMATGTTTIPFDNTIPQNTEGTEFMTQAITPKSATNKLVIEVTFYGALSIADDLIMALFQDSTANALAATSVYNGTASGRSSIKLEHTMTAGTTSATTFKVRAGGAAASTVTFNGVSGSARFGAITKSSIKITEYKA